MKLVNLLIILFTSLSSLSSYTHAYPQYNGNVPNGNSIPPSAIALGHPNGNVKQYTAFANAYVSNGRKWTRQLCLTDSDGDGQSNGLEMGDPCCLWVSGASPMFASGLSDPNNPAMKTTNTNSSCV